MLTHAKIKAAIIGSGNIATDLLYKMRRSAWLEPVWMVGVDPGSDGLKRASRMGLKTTPNGVQSFLLHVAADAIQVAFDASSAVAHEANVMQLTARGLLTIDLTPAAIGPFCVPPINLSEHVGKREMIINMVTCGGQATIPIVRAISQVQSISYAEIVATVASRSAGPGTRKNIDEFTRTTARAIEAIGGVPKGKAIIIINPAEPPLVMRNTIHCLATSDPDPVKIGSSIQTMIGEVQKYVPGYRLRNGPVVDGRRVSVFMEVEGLGDYLPKYAGNLDIMTAAAVRTGEMIAQEIVGGRLMLPSGSSTS